MNEVDDERKADKEKQQFIMETIEKKCFGGKAVLLSIDNLVLPTKEHSLRELNQRFVDTLVEAMKSNPSHLSPPLVGIVRKYL